ncbi:MAG: class I SAM-dependent methyltransferase [Anaerolineales bacterium]|nr:class I SAM-dependent methyltransferase [Anaerolineales bacterium]
MDKIALIDLVRREMAPKPWVEGEKIPWNDPDFSRRMLKEHLSQKHDAASRRTPIIKKHVNWIHSSVLGGIPSRILDLGCGPGLYSARLAKLGHACRGIDFSPASVEYAVKRAPDSCSYTLGDIRLTDFGSGYDLVMLIFGEFNVFKPDDAGLILRKARAALNPGGKLLLEVTTFDTVYEIGNQPAIWYSAENELFADEPHLCLMESFWDNDGSVAIERYYIVDAASGEVTRYSASTQAYEEEQFKGMLSTVGFSEVDIYPSLLGKENPSQRELFVLVARKDS